jgi:hypothetical protein
MHLERGAVQWGPSFATFAVMTRKNAPLLVLLVAVSCSSNASTNGGGGSGGSGERGVASLFDTRYCEILLADVEGDTATIRVFNTVGLNDCPADRWEALDVEQIAEEQAVFVAFANGPRYWTIDAASGGDAATGEVEELGGIEMQKVAELELPLARALELQSSADPFADVIVDRDNAWTYNTGREVYELVNPEGDVYVMQSYSHQVDDTLTSADLPSLEERLELPAGWTFRARLVTTELVVSATGQATVIQDELRNTYQKR